MDFDSDRYWPFDVLPPDQQSEQHRDEIQFLEAAFREGFAPYQFGTQNFAASFGDRSGVIFYRTRTRWEAVLGSGAKTVLSAYFGDFGPAARAILLWLRGGDADEIANHVPGRIESATEMMAHRRK